jgi:hypothetical protein
MAIKCKKCTETYPNEFYEKKKGKIGKYPLCLFCLLAMARFQRDQTYLKLKRLEAAERVWTDEKMARLIKSFSLEFSSRGDRTAYIGMPWSSCVAKARALGLFKPSPAIERQYSDEQLAKMYYYLHIARLSCEQVAPLVGLRTKNQVIGANRRHIMPCKEKWRGKWEPPPGTILPLRTNKHRPTTRDRWAGRLREKVNDEHSGQNK